MAQITETEQEDKLHDLYAEIDVLFRKVDGTKDEQKRAGLLKEITNKLKDAKT